MVSPTQQPPWRQAAPAMARLRVRLGTAHKVPVRNRAGVVGHHASQLADRLAIARQTRLKDGPA